MVRVCGVCGGEAVEFTQFAPVGFDVGEFDVFIAADEVGQGGDGEGVVVVVGGEFRGDRLD
jgi:hypothetical protein